MAKLFVYETLLTESSPSIDRVEMVIDVLRYLPDLSELVLHTGRSDKDYRFRLKDTNWQAKIKGAAAAVLVDPDNEFTSQSLVLSNPFCAFYFNKLMNEVHVYDDCAQSKIQLWSDLVCRLGIGFGYVKEFDTPLSAIAYSKNLSIVHDKRSISEILSEVYTPSWTFQKIRLIKNKTARSVYNCNVWPDSFYEEISQSRLIDSVKPISVTRLSNKVSLYRVSDQDRITIKRVLGVHFFE